jgi:hypothetical protein
MLDLKAPLIGITDLRMDPTGLTTSIHGYLYLLTMEVVLEVLGIIGRMAVQVRGMVHLSS